jgi:hypothetical protein
MQTGNETAGKERNGRGGAKPGAPSYREAKGGDFLHQNLPCLKNIVILSDQEVAKRKSGHV